MRKLKNEELGRISAEEYDRNKKNPVVLVLDNVRSLNNIGSVFRTADGFRLEKVILCGISTCPPHREIHKTALGAENSVSWQYFATAKEAIEDLRSSGYTIMSVEQAVDSTQLPDLSLNGKTPLALIFGHEVKGVDQEVVDLSDECIESPQSGTKHSFNISVSVGIVLWEVRAKL